MTQPLSLNSQSYKTTENLWASNVEGPQSFETWRVRFWSKCQCQKKAEQSWTSECKTPVQQQYSPATCSCERLFNYTVSVNKNSHIVFFCFLSSLFPGLKSSLLSTLQALLLRTPATSRQCRQNKSLVLQPGLDASPVNKNNCVWWGWRHHRWGVDEKVHICGPVVNLCYICVNSLQYKVVDVLLLFHPNIHHYST